ncbi:RES family NAD+ phosphorylase [Pseudomonas chlororaphis]|uniref:RES family NAD+ phosphorylase n=1 Tax=Pseudomonas chlororaphis TaxID=587753 RepID=UPI0035D45B1C
MDELLEPICFECVGDSFLQRMIINAGKKGECLTCGKNQLSIELESLANEVAKILSDTVEIGDYHDIWDIESDRISHTEQSGDPLNYFVTEILRLEDEDDPLIDLVMDKFVGQSPGDESFFDHENYSRKTIVPFETELNWIQFQSELMHKRRFFNEKAKRFLEWLFDGIDSYHVWGFGPGVVRTLTPDECEPIYRARDCTPPKDESQKIIGDPANQLAAPPKELAPTGRMSPAGVPVFYGAFERETCIAELRPPVGGKVISGEFRLTKDARVLDFTALEDAYDRTVISYFDPEFIRKVERRQFLKDFHGVISHPVVPDQEHEYLKTQVIAEYLATQHSPNFDGVIFASAQAKHDNGRNIVLFSHVISTELLPPVPNENGWTFLFGEPAEPGIQYVPESLIIHKIETVKVTTKNTKVIGGELECDIDDFYERGY